MLPVLQAISGEGRIAPGWRIVHESEEQIKKICEELVLCQDAEQARIKAEELREAIRNHLNRVRVELRVMSGVFEP